MPIFTVHQCLSCFDENEKPISDDASRNENQKGEVKISQDTAQVRQLFERTYGFKALNQMILMRTGRTRILC
jgi:hypothetical protein